VRAFLKELPLAVPPQVLILDVGLPDISGLEALPQLTSRLPDTEIVMYTVFEDPDTIYQALCLGAGGYVLKNTPLPQIKSALIEVASGGAPLSRSVARRVLAHFKPRPSAQPDLLTPRERQVLTGIVDGLTDKQVAIRLALSPETVRTHVKSIYRKLQVTTRGELISRAARGQL
jgi:DNA-binding NarL/FixJ family response regulator